MSEFNNIGSNDKIDFNTKDGGEYLFFYLKNELYAIDIFKVSEIIECSNITAIPIMNDFIDGISSVRGNLIPIVNLHARLDFDKTKKTNAIKYNHFASFKIFVFLEKLITNNK